MKSLIVIELEKLFLMKNKVAELDRDPAIGIEAVLRSIYAFNCIMQEKLNVLETTRLSNHRVTAKLAAVFS